jgi:uncharacterized membrane protein
MTGKRWLAAGIVVGVGLASFPAFADGLADWLLSPASGSATHEIAAGIAWHGRLMVLAWAFLMPLAVVIARYFKITPRQKWPARLDNPFWFITHRRLGSVIAFVVTGAVLLAIAANGWSVVPRTTHGWLGLAVLLLTWLQIVNGLLRGTHGGPVDPFTRQKKPVEQWPGDHFSMTRRRIVFEHVHKAIGYLLIVLSAIALLAGLHEADAPRWMWLAIVIWWIVLVVVVGILQSRVGTIDTYQAIWGLDRTLPGYRRAPIGIGITRFNEESAGSAPWQKGSPS